MNKKFASVIALLLVLSMLLIACDKTPVDDTQTTETTENTETTEPFVEVSPYPVTETLFESDVSEELYEIYKEGKVPFKGCTTLDASYVIGNAVAISDCRLLSMTVPVYKTGKADENGDFVLTLFVYEFGFNKLKTDPKRSYEIKINADAYGLTANKSKINNVIKVDLSSYDINIAADEQLGFFAKTDTLYPAFVYNVSDTSNAARNLIREKAPHLVGSIIKAGTTNANFSYDTLIVDFEWEKVYEKKSEYLALKNKTEYNTIVEALKEKYEGKYVSVIGDSVSTFAGVSNDGTANVTIAGNEPYYPSPSVCDESLTYWGKLIKDVGMKTCVINSWSGSSAYGREFGKNMLIRCTDLHRDGGTPDDPSDDIAPDVIIVYLGCNDINGGSPLDNELLNITSNGSDKSKIDAWFAKVLDVAERVGGAEKGKTYTNFAQVYALSLHAMREKYPNAEIYCLTLQESNHPNATKASRARFNQSISAIADYFGATVVDQENDIITVENCYAYTGDTSNSLHPNVWGHEIMAENIAKAMYKNLK